MKQASNQPTCLKIYHANNLTVHHVHAASTRQSKRFTWLPPLLWHRKIPSALSTRCPSVSRHMFPCRITLIITAEAGILSCFSCGYTLSRYHLNDLQCRRFFSASRSSMLQAHKSLKKKRRGTYCSLFFVVIF
jgi:hypothetical protein